LARKVNIPNVFGTSQDKMNLSIFQINLLARIMESLQTSKQKEEYYFYGLILKSSIKVAW
jgi:hypothetical protein